MKEHQTPHKESRISLSALLEWSQRVWFLEAPRAPTHFWKQSSPAKANIGFSMIFFIEWATCWMILELFHFGSDTQAVTCELKPNGMYKKVKIIMFCHLPNNLCQSMAYYDLIVVKVHVVTDTYLKSCNVFLNAQKMTSNFCFINQCMNHAMNIDKLNIHPWVSWSRYLGRYSAGFFVWSTFFPSSMMFALLQALFILWKSQINLQLSKKCEVMWRVGLHAIHPTTTLRTF